MGRQKMNILLMVHSLSAHRSKELGTQCRLPKWVARTCLFAPSLTAFLGACFHEAGIRKKLEFKLRHWYRMHIFKQLLSHSTKHPPQPWPFQETWGHTSRVLKSWQGWCYSCVSKAAYRDPSISHGPWFVSQLLDFQCSSLIMAWE